MKKDKIAVVLIGVVMLGLLLGGCKKEYVMVEKEDSSNSQESSSEVHEIITEEQNSGVETNVKSLFVPGELVGLSDTEDEAREIASKYGIELKSYSYGVATYWAGEDADLEAIIEEGAAKGYPSLSLNYVYSLDDGISLD